jgi:hypothetical protein
MSTVTIEMFHSLEKRMTTVEERLHGGSESFAENRKEIRDVRKQVADLRESMIELVGRDGRSGTIAILSELAGTLRETVTRLEHVITGLTDDVRDLAGIGAKVERHDRVYWKLGVLAGIGGALAGTAVTAALHFLT